MYKYVRMLRACVCVHACVRECVCVCVLWLKLLPVVTSMFLAEIFMCNPPVSFALPLVLLLYNSRAAVNTGNKNGLIHNPYDNLFYQAPSSEPRVQVFDLSTGYGSGINVCSPFGYTGDDKFGGIGALSSFLYMPPFDELVDHLVVYDISTGDISGISTSSIYTGDSKWYGFANVGSIFVSPPFRADALLVFDATTYEVSGISTSSVSTTQGWAGIAVHNSLFVAAPYNSESILVYNLATGQVSGVDVSAHYGSTSEHRWWGVANRENVFMFAPCAAPALLEFNSVTFAVSSYDTTGIADNNNKWRGIAPVGTTDWFTCNIPSVGEKLQGGVCCGTVDGFKKQFQGVQPRKHKKT